MKKILFLLAIGLLSNVVFSQTYYYIDSLSVVPENPGSTDNIEISVYGSFSDGSIVMDSTDFEIIGYEIYLHFYVQSTGIGVPVLVPHDELFSIGSLPVGDYHINLEGNFVGDFVVDTTQKYFTVVDDLGIEEPSNSAKVLLKIFDVSGRPAEPSSNTVLIYYYSDGTF